MILHESEENYLEAILILQEERGSLRSVDLAEFLGFTKASVSRALKNLREKDLAVVEEGGRILLTPEGQSIAEAVYERHRFLTRLLMSMGVPQEQAVADACRMEHILSPTSYNAIQRYFRREEEA